MIARGYSVYIFSINHNEHSNKILKNIGATPIHHSLSRAGLNPISDIISTIQLTRKINQIKPDIVFSFFPKPAIFGTLAASMAKTPRIVAMLEGLGYSFTPCEGNKFENFKKKFIRFFQVFLYKLSFVFLDRLIFLNLDDPIDLLDKYRIKVKDYKILGGIGVSLDDYPYVHPSLSPVRFIFIGRLLVEKGIHEFIKATQYVKHIYPETEFVILGTIDTKNPGSLTNQELNNLIKEQLINYPGHVDDVHEWINNSSVFVLPSYREGIPLSTQEAMSVGRPIITTDVPGCRETVEDGINGFLIPPKNTEELAKRMIFFIENPEKIVSMGLKSREKAKKDFCAITQAERLFNLIVND